MKKKILLLTIALGCMTITSRSQTSTDSTETVTDIDGNVYKTVKIGTQVWTTSNLQTLRLNDGTPIPNVKDNALWTGIKAPAFCTYENDEKIIGDNRLMYIGNGALYNAYTINSNKLAPAGWHIPSYEEWITLMEFLGRNEEAFLKITKDKNGFFATKAGVRAGAGKFMFGNTSCYWWSSTSMGNEYNIGFYLSEKIGEIVSTLSHEDYGYSVRLVKNSDPQKQVQKEIPQTDNETVKDIDGNVYHTVKIGTQTWMVENLKTTKYRNGDLIETSKKPTTDLTKVDDPKYQWAYGANESNVAIYGRLYTWFAATDSRNITPVGWHVPSKWEWQLMKYYLEANGFQNDTSDWLGNRSFAKSISATTNWNSSSKKGSLGNTDFPEKRNITGFTALPGGYRFNLGDNKFGPGAFLTMGSYAYWWSASEYKLEYKTAYKTVINVDKAFHIYLSSDEPGVVEANSSKKDGFSVRCIKD
jgi:uncharacterized protein (TIGR02145 family)